MQNKFYLRYVKPYLLATAAVVLAANAVDEQEPYEHIAAVAALAVITAAIVFAAATQKNEYEENVVAAASVVEHGDYPPCEIFGNASLSDFTRASESGNARRPLPFAFVFRCEDILVS